MADLDPPNPVDGQRFVLKVSLDNGGDIDFAIASVEESIPSGDLPFAPVTSLKAPSRIAVGETLPVYDYVGVLGHRSNFQKTIRVTDSPRGDSWSRSFYIRPCGK